jgi:hypothetical protein
MLNTGKNISDIVDRIKAVKGLKTDSQVAESLKISLGALSNHKTRRSIPYDALSTFCDDEGLSFDWLLTGEGPKRRAAIDVAHEQAAIYGMAARLDLGLLKDVITEVERDLERRGTRLSPEKKAEVIALIYEEIAEDEDKKAAMEEKIVKLIRLAS